MNGAIQLASNPPGINWRKFAELAALAILVVALWDTWAVFPLKILVVFLHELSHGLTAIATGGRVIEVQVNAAQGGLCITQGGNRFLTLSAGYLGSLVMGGAILLASSHLRRGNLANLLLGLLLFVTTVIYVRPVIGFGFLFGAVSGIALVAGAQRMPAEANRFVLALIGLTSTLYAFVDIKSDVLDRPGARSDAAMLADLTGIPTLVWGVGWLAVGMVLAVWFLIVASRRRPPS